MSRSADHRSGRLRVYRGLVAGVFVVLAVVVALWWDRGGGSSVGVGESEVEQAFRNGSSEVMVEATGRVDRVFKDDNRGSRHQRFTIRLPSGHTVLVTHNIDLAPRVPVDIGDRVSLRGQYEWNDRGGVVHWTHHDPDNRRPGGWILHDGREYR